MIKIFCDICNESMKEYEYKVDMPEESDAICIYVQSKHLCEKCQDVLIGFDRSAFVKEQIKKKIIDMRVDIPKCEENKKITCPYCSKEFYN